MTCDLPGKIAGIGAKEIRIWGLAIVATAFWANVLWTAGIDRSNIVSTTIDAVVSNGAFDVLAWALVFARVLRLPDDRSASPQQIASVFLLGCIVLIPARATVAIAMVGLSLRFATDKNLQGAGRPVTCVLIALAVETFWTTSLMAPLHVFVAQFDAKLCAALLSLLGKLASAHGNIVENGSADFSIAIMPYCTSSMPLATVAVAFVVTVSYYGRTLEAQHIPWLCVAFLTSVLLTEVRLVLLATGEASYSWWHNGPGLTVYAFVAVGFAVGISILATFSADGASANVTNQRTA